MKSELPTVENIREKAHRYLVRVDFNVPLDAGTGAITDDTRIRKALPTIELLLNRGGAVVLVSHLGRPKGRDPKESLKPIAERLQQLMPNHKVLFAPEDIGEATAKKAAALNPGEILLLENIRFSADETAKEKDARMKLAKKLAAHADVYIDDAFGAVHREHASIVEIAEILPAYAGLLLKKEIEVITRLLNRPPRPFVAIIGGAKVSSKIAVLENLITKVDILLIGGAMAYTFLKSRLVETGNSMVEKEFLSKAFQIIDKAAYRQIELHLPEDHIIANDFSPKAKIKTSGKAIPEGWMGMDIGPKTVDKYSKIIKTASTVLWNGPMGVFEMEPFAQGTVKIAKALIKSKGTTVVGGGDSVYAVEKAGVADKVSHISTGGGATLEMLEGRKLPGVEVLLK